MEDRTENAKNIRGVAVPVFLIAGLSIAWLLFSAGRSQQSIASTAISSGDGSGQSSVSPKIIFNRDIRPILADRCFSCHGPDLNKRQAGLRLDRPEAALGPLPGHPKLRAFVPGDPEHSEALKRILTGDPTSIMPPLSSHRSLDAKEKQLIRQWVIQAGPYQEHWAYNKPVRPPLPEVQNKSWPQNEIDRFVLANLESHGLAPSRQADKATLIRRVSLDITGIPPAPAEVDAFMADNSPDAFEKVVDRLFASPRYGEQMATTWLDYARYADSHGYQSDPERHMWKWRDWVINACNSNMPFDEFAVEQLAGDLLPNATTDQKIATGFNRNHRINDEGGIIGEEWRVEGVIDRVSTTSAVFLGLTMECCRCHDHKFDPITQKEFYSFSAYFNSVNEQGVGDTAYTDKGNNVPPVLKVPTPDQQEQLGELTAKSTAITANIDELKKRTPNQVATLEQTGFTLPEPKGLMVRLPLDGDIHGEDSQQYPVDTKFTGKGDPVFTRGNFGKAVRFDVSGSAVDAGDVIHFDRKDSFSYGAWLNRRGGGSFISKMDAGNAYRGFDMYIDENRVAMHIIHHWPDNAIKVRTTAALPPNLWKHVFAPMTGRARHPV